MALCVVAPGARDYAQVDNGPVMIPLEGVHQIELMNILSREKPVKGRVWMAKRTAPYSSFVRCQRSSIAELLANWFVECRTRAGLVRLLQRLRHTSSLGRGQRVHSGWQPGQPDPVQPDSWPS